MPPVDDAEWDESTGARRPHVGDLLKGAGLALAAGVLTTLAVAGALVTLLVVSLGPSHRHGPGDGRHSRRLPVALSPASQLADGDTVHVRASRLAGAGEAIIAECGVEADRDNRGVAACDLAHRIRVPVHRGSVEASFHLSQSVVLGGRRVECASVGGRCVLMVASAENYDRSGFAALGFLRSST